MAHVNMNITYMLQLTPDEMKLVLGRLDGTMNDEESDAAATNLCVKLRLQREKAAQHMSRSMTKGERE